MKLTDLPWPKSKFTFGFYLKSHVRDLLNAVSLFKGRLIFSFGISILFGVALVLPGSLWLFYTYLVSLDDDWQGKPGMVGYLEPGISEVEIEVIKKRLVLLTDVEEVSVISAEEGLELFGEATGIGDLEELLGSNPLPVSIRAILSADRGSQYYENLESEAEQIAGVDDVVLEIEWIENLGKITDLVSLLLVIYTILFAIACSFISFASIRIAIEDQLVEIKVMRLVGATMAQIRRPFLYCGVVYGLMGGLFGLGSLFIALVWVYEPLRFFLDKVFSNLKFFDVTAIFIPAAVVLACSLGWLGALLCVRQQLKKLEIL